MSILFCMYFHWTTNLFYESIIWSSLYMQLTTLHFVLLNVPFNFFVKLMMMLANVRSRYQIWENREHESACINNNKWSLLQQKLQRFCGLKTDMSNKVQSLKRKMVNSERKIIYIITSFYVLFNAHQNPYTFLKRYYLIQCTHMYVLCWIKKVVVELSLLTLRFQWGWWPPTCTQQFFFSLGAKDVYFHACMFHLKEKKKEREVRGKHVCKSLILSSSTWWYTSKICVSSKFSLEKSW